MYSKSKKLPTMFCRIAMKGLPSEPVAKYYLRKETASWNGCLPPGRLPLVATGEEDAVGPCDTAEGDPPRGDPPMTQTSDPGKQQNQRRGKYDGHVCNRTQVLENGWNFHKKKDVIQDVTAERARKLWPEGYEGEGDMRIRPLNTPTRTPQDA